MGAEKTEIKNAEVFASFIESKMQKFSATENILFMVCHDSCHIGLSAELKKKL